MQEPIHTQKARTTADSIAEGRVKIDGESKKKKKKFLLQEIKKYYNR